MPIHLLTGSPGHGKTALMVELLLAESKRAERPIFAAGIDGLQPGLASVLGDPRQWNAKDSQGDYLVAAGAIIFIDEAWKWFGHLHDASRQPTPPHVLDLAEHRHRGLDFVWTTQQTGQLYPFVRGLIGQHTHVKRRFGTGWIDVWTWGELIDNVKSSSSRERAQYVLRRLPSQAYGFYRSAQVHTIKARLPFKVFLLPGVVVVAIVCIVVSYRALRPASFSTVVTGAQERPTAELAKPGATASPRFVEGERGEGPRWQTVTAYAKDHLPRFASMPWTAPIYDHRSPTTDPQLICMSGGEGLDAQGVFKGLSCTCYTEQGTLYEIADGECRRIARRGPVYNPYREPSQEQGVVQQAHRPVLPMQRAGGEHVILATGHGQGVLP
ncbi:hypothetical protein FUT69_09650, partial [Xylella taiwanensis]